MAAKVGARYPHEPSLSWRVTHQTTRHAKRAKPANHQTSKPASALERHQTASRVVLRRSLSIAGVRCNHEAHSQSRGPSGHGDSGSGWLVCRHDLSALRKRHVLVLSIASCLARTPLNSPFRYTVAVPAVLSSSNFTVNPSDIVYRSEVRWKTWTHLRVFLVHVVGPRERRHWSGLLDPSERLMWVTLIPGQIAGQRFFELVDGDAALVAAS